MVFSLYLVLLDQSCKLHWPPFTRTCCSWALIEAAPKLKRPATFLSLSCFFVLIKTVFKAFWSIWGHFLVNFGNFMVNIWSLFGHFLVFWSLFGHFLVTFWSLFGHFLVTFWSLFGHFLVTFLVNFWSICGQFVVNFSSISVQF